MLYNKLVGPVRMRQVRSTRKRCDNLPTGVFVYPCYNEDDYITDHMLYEPRPGEFFAVPYGSASELETSSWTGVVQKYPGGGQYLDLSPTNETLVKETFDKLFELQFLDSQTRALFVDFTSYNGNINKFCNVRIAFEMPVYGGVHASVKYSAVKLYRYSARSDYFILTFEIVLLMLMFNYVEVQTQKIKAFGLKEYFEDFWTSYDILNFVVMFICVGMRGYWIYVVYHMELTKVTDTKFVNLFEIGQFLLVENGMNSVNCLMIYLRAFKFFQLHPRFKTFQDVWMKAAPDLWAFWCILFITLISYTCAMYVCFSLQVEQFKTFGDSFLMIISYMVGAYNLEEMRDDGHWMLGPFYVLTFMIQVYFCLMNIPMIILGDAYSWAFRQKTERKTLMVLVRKEIATYVVQNIECLRKAEEEKLRLQERTRLQDEGAIIMDAEQDLLIEDVDLAIEEIGGEDEWAQLLKLAGLDNVDVWHGNVTPEEYKLLMQTIASVSKKR